MPAVVCDLSRDGALGCADLPVNVRLLPVVHQAKRLVIPEGVSPPTLLNRELVVALVVNTVFKDFIKELFGFFPPSHTSKVLTINYPMSRIM